jgi:hypothetical protein
MVKSTLYDYVLLSLKGTGHIPRKSKGFRAVPGNAQAGAGRLAVVCRSLKPPKKES